MEKRQGLFCLFFTTLVIILLPNVLFAQVSNDPNVKQWSYNDLGLYKAWASETGSKDVVVAIIDNGFDTFHPDLYDNVWKNSGEIAGNNIDDDKNGYIDDIWGWNFSYKDLDGSGGISAEESFGNNDPRPSAFDIPAVEDFIHHGTLVAGIIGSVGNNLTDGVGVNWNVSLMNLKVVESNGDGSASALVNAIRYAVDNNADVINISMVTGLFDEKINDAIKYAYENNVAVVAAAGNNSRSLNVSPLYPVCTDEKTGKRMVLGVSAMNEDHRKAFFSNFGSNCIDITAPGTNIASTMRYAPRYGLTEQYGGGWSGTSFATPFVSGALALVKSIQPSWGVDKLFDAVLSTVHRTPPKDPESYAHLFGAGLLQIDKAVKFAMESLPEVPKGNTVVAVDLKTGLIEYNDLKKEEISLFTKKTIAGINSITSFVDNGQTKFATIKRENGKVKISILNSDFKVESSFNVPLFSSDLGIKVGNVLGSAEYEIILFPKYSSFTTFIIYSKTGEYLDSKEVKIKHTGVSLDLVNGVEKTEIVLVYKNADGKFSLKHFDTNLAEKKEIPLSFFKVLPNFNVGDLDGDKKEEFVVSSRKNQEPFVSIYEQNGDWSRTFYANSPSYTGGFSSTIIDYDNDGKDDIVLNLLSGEKKISVWNYRSKKIGKWVPFNGKNVSNAHLFAIK
ncbi:MAG: S8 family serine peptidase [Candidatus Magasanikbacteria bacterium]|nr:S8 family serine peptidase [Candidatus Magasanikbacteria bacterium]